MPPESRDTPFMEEALALARRGLGRTWPNPAVGAVVEHRGQILGRGSHPGAGQPHAEVLALEQAGNRARGATVHVTLEPCCHHGRTPPCVDALLEAGVARVVFGCSDPNPLVAGMGLERLRAAGVEVHPSALESSARELVSGFSTRVLEGRPEILLKAASTLDGQIAPAGGVARWISGPQSRERTHELRDQWDGILVGSGTVLGDDPSLTVRDPEPEDGHQPFRIVLDRRGRISTDARCLGEGSLVLTGEASGEGWRERILARGGELRVLPGEAALGECLTALGERGLTRVLVEGGSRIHGALLGERLADRVALFYGPLLVGAGGFGLSGGFRVDRLEDAVRLEETRMEQLGSDWLVEGRLVYAPREE